jgi:hypothetical protein
MDPRRQQVNLAVPTLFWFYYMGLNGFFESLSRNIFIGRLIRPPGAASTPSIDETLDD